MIILIGGEKGGTGKSTISTNLSALCARRGLDVVLVDADKQGSSKTWYEERTERNVSPSPACVEITGRALRERVLDLATRYEHVIIDAGGRDSAELRGALVVADKLYTPMQASHADAWTLERMENLLDEVSMLRDPLPAFVVLSRGFTNPNIPETADATRLVDSFELLSYSGVMLCERIAYRRAFGLGLGVGEMEEPDEKAVTEIEALFAHVFQG